MSDNKDEDIISMNDNKPLEKTFHEAVTHLIECYVKSGYDVCKLYTEMSVVHRDLTNNLTQNESE